MADLPRSALVLGGGSEIGAAIVIELAARGLRRAVLAARNPAVAGQTLRDARVPSEVEVIAEPWDARDVATHDDRIGEMFERHGPFDLVICAVGILGHHAGVGMGPVDVDEMVRSNFAGPAAALSVVGRLLVDRCSGPGGAGQSATIVVLSSVAGVRPRKSNYVYGSSKAGLDSFARGLGDAIAGTGVDVLVVRPGFVRSKMTTGLEPAPMWSTPAAVAARVAKALESGGGGVVWVPPKLGPLMAILQNAPLSVWRRVAADR